MTKTNRQIMQNIKYTDNLTKAFDNPEIQYYLTNLVLNTQKVTGLNSKNKALDIGAGIGFMSKILSELNIDCTSLDFNTHSLKYGQKIGWIKKYLVGSIYKLPPKTMYDLVLLIDVIEHLDHPDKALLEIKKVLNKNKYLVIHTPNQTYSKLLHITWDVTHVHEYNYFELAHLLEKCGYKIIFAFGDLPFIAKRFPKIANFISYHLGKTFFYLNPYLYGPSFYIVAQKHS